MNDLLKCAGAGKGGLDVSIKEFDALYRAHELVSQAEQIVCSAGFDVIDMRKDSDRPLYIHVSGWGDNWKHVVDLLGGPHEIRGREGIDRVDAFWRLGKVVVVSVLDFSLEQARRRWPSARSIDRGQVA